MAVDVPELTSRSASIGRGGFGTVFNTLHKDSKTSYAVKMVRKTRQLPPHGGEDPVDREIGILKEISHVRTFQNLSALLGDSFHDGQPSVVKLYDVYTQGHTYCEQLLSSIATRSDSLEVLAMELIPEGSLHDLLKEQRQIGMCLYVSLCLRSLIAVLSGFGREIGHHRRLCRPGSKSRWL